MSMAPRGPLPARVYWIRRGIVLAVALLLVVVVAKLLSGGSDGSEDADGGSAKDSMQLSGAGASSRAADGSTDAASDEAAARKGQPLAEPSGACDPEQVTVTTVGGKRPNDGKVGIVLAIGTSEDACTFTVSNDSVVVKIESGTDTYWSSQHCRVIPTEDVVARAAKPARVRFEWDGLRYDNDCSRPVAWARPGSYHVIAAPLGGEPSDTQFELTRPPGVVITKTAKPEVTPTPTATTSKKPSAKASAPASHGEAGATDQP